MKTVFAKGTPTQHRRAMSQGTRKASITQQTVHVESRTPPLMLSHSCTRVCMNFTGEESRQGVSRLPNTAAAIKGAPSPSLGPQTTPLWQAVPLLGRANVTVARNINNGSDTAQKKTRKRNCYFGPSDSQDPLLRTIGRLCARRGLTHHAPGSAAEQVGSHGCGDCDQPPKAQGKRGAPLAESSGVEGACAWALSPRPQGAGVSGAGPGACLMWFSLNAPERGGDNTPPPAMQTSRVRRGGQRCSSHGDIAGEADSLPLARWSPKRPRSRGLLSSSTEAALAPVPEPARQTHPAQPDKEHRPCETAELQETVQQPHWSEAYRKGGAHLILSQPWALTHSSAPSEREAKDNPPCN